MAGEGDLTGFGSTVEIDHATSAVPFRNSLGMQFVPVQISGGPTDSLRGRTRVYFSTTLTTVAQYRLFASLTSRDWTKPPFDQMDDHPAVRISWFDAMAFCEWLTDREHAAGTLPDCAKYRLPSDHEWSCAVGIGRIDRLTIEVPDPDASFLRPVLYRFLYSDEIRWLCRLPDSEKLQIRHQEDPPVNPAEKEDADATPREKSLKIPGYPWGTDWPPAKGAGNYADEALYRRHVAWSSTGRFDGYSYTSPVHAFEPNSDGLYDMGGNVWQWCMDTYDPDDTTFRVLRGASWYYAEEFYLRSSYRNFIVPTFHYDDVGFRCVIAVEMEN